MRKLLTKTTTYCGVEAEGPKGHDPRIFLPNFSSAGVLPQSFQQLSFRTLLVFVTTFLMPFSIDSSPTTVTFITANVPEK